MCKCFNVDNWYKLQSEPTKGSRDKQWVVKPADDTSNFGELYLFKESNKRYPAEFWVEIVASEIGKLVGVKTPETYCARMGEKYAALIKFFLKIEWDEKNNRHERTETLFEGGDIITSSNPTFDRKKGERHNIYTVEKIFLNYERGESFKEFLKILIFDAIIGNTDRHQDNWGFIFNNKTNTIVLAPAYDNSTSLGSELLDEKLSDYFDENEVKLIRYINKGKPHLRWSENGEDLERINHFQFLDNIYKEKPYISDYVIEMTSFSDVQVEEVLDKVSGIKIENPKYRLTQIRKNLIKRIICIRRDLLKNKFNIL